MVLSSGATDSPPSNLHIPTSIYPSFLPLHPARLNPGYSITWQNTTLFPKHNKTRCTKSTWSRSSGSRRRGLRNTVIPLSYARLLESQNWCPILHQHNQLTSHKTIRHASACSMPFWTHPLGRQWAMILFPVIADFCWLWSISPPKEICVSVTFCFLSYK